MKYTYAYKTSDGVRHEDSMNASSREEVFETLRAKGIKAIKVVAADGSKANGEVRGVRKRVVVALVALAAVCAGVIAYIGGERTGANVAPDPAVSSPRHQIYGDPAIMEGLERGNFSDVLPRDGDRLLAIFAQPGKLMCAKGADPRRLDEVTAILFADYAKSLLRSEYDLPILPEDPREVQELKQIVNGMRDEMREYLANGNGNVRSYWRRLNERTLSEMRIYERTRRELEKETSPAVWEQKNEALRRLGLLTIPNPHE
ncbi:MAG: hypothetical protein IJG13_16655 [Kiritimatiellae bacterium]|nr:hypothetical protein [Kiritimatiellia bacterium]MBQ3344854.1 hypothetical protein [Kiritimatiellia bacterium]